MATVRMCRWLVICLLSQEVERDESWCLVYFPLFIRADKSALEGCCPPLGVSLYPLVKPLWNHPQSHLEVCLLGDSKPSQID